MSWPPPNPRRTYRTPRVRPNPGLEPLLQRNHNGSSMLFPVSGGRTAKVNLQQLEIKAEDFTPTGISGINWADFIAFKKAWLGVEDIGPYRSLLRKHLNVKLTSSNQHSLGHHRHGWRRSPSVTPLAWNVSSNRQIASLLFLFLAHKNKIWVD